eukprot:TRINITY_DN2938_c0_g1_i3.p1 TRINITY_DN2938_c0_g1~~TRINITY_DN2938_c0_g1_i3.p1  ORF type:complete len:308 (+),score=59.56 TRINITY_DN2938_c0_g1_i3:398-1321(+)
MRVLPTDYNTPILWEEDEREFLHGTDLDVGLADVHAAYEKNVAPMVSAFPDLFSRASDFRSFAVWGSAMASRAFEADPTHSGPVMVPMADMLNHRTGCCNAHLEDDADGRDCGMSMILQKDVSRGDEIFNTYGDLSNAELLRRYGYVDPSPNPFDVVYIAPADLFGAYRDSGAAVEERVAWLARTLATAGGELYLRWEHGGCGKRVHASGRLVSAACALLLPPVRFALLRRTFARHGFGAVPVSMRADLAVVTVLRRAAEQRLARSGAAAPETETEAEEAPESRAGRRRLADVVRHGEQCLLRAFTH